MRASKQSGFTLIELVVVIVILGILSAFAVPKFMGMETQARISSVRALEGSLRSAASMARGLSLASGNPAIINIEGRNVAMAFGYPTAAAMVLTIDDSAIHPTTPGRFAHANGVFSLNGATDITRCDVTYVPPTVANRPPQITVDIRAC